MKKVNNNEEKPTKADKFTDKDHLTFPKSNFQFLQSSV